jgi:hypothetical protein
MKVTKPEAPSAGPTQAAAGAEKKAEKVNSSRYEWERRAGEPDNPPPAPKAARGPLLAAIGAWLKKLFAVDFFDNDDDATPSAA